MCWLEARGIPESNGTTMDVLKAVDFFCSGGGMTCGMRQAGVNVLAGIDNDPSCQTTYELNNPGSRFLLADVNELRPKTLVNTLGLKTDDDNLILIGCSPCQYWSKIQTDKTKSRASRNLLLEFGKFVHYFNPGYVLVENVPGILSKKGKSGLTSFVENLEEKGYVVHYGVVNMNDYGVPQSRRRFSLLASRLHDKPFFPKPLIADKPTVKDFIGEKNGFDKIDAGHHDLTDFNHSTAEISERNLRRLKRTRRDGGSWADWAEDPDLGRLRYKGKEFMDNYGRMSWSKPSPTITTRFISISNGRFGHPDENRGLSIREGATLQTFPRTYVFPKESITLSAKIIGNAVPPLFANILAKAIVKAHNNRK